MRRIYALAAGRSFVELAEALAETGLDLARVVSCTFPGRPEPKSADWTLPSGPTVLHYAYIPDTELRYLHVVSPDFQLFADGEPAGDRIVTFFEAQLGGSPFDDFESLRDDLHEGEHRSSLRAAAGFRVAAHAGDPTVDGEAELVDAVRRAAGSGPVHAASQLVEVATARFREEIEELRENAADFETRMHLQRARERILNRL